MSPQAMLGLGVGLPLLAIGGYVAWLAHRVERLEERAEADGGGEGGDPREDAP